MDFDARQRGALDKRIQCFPWKDNGQYWPLGAKLPGPENKTSLSDTNSAKLIIASLFQHVLLHCNLHMTWQEKDSWLSSPRPHTHDWWPTRLSCSVDYSTTGWEKKKKQQYSKWLFFTPIRPVNVLKKWLQKASNKWIHFRGKWFGSLFISALWKWNQFYVSLRSKCLLRRQIYGLEPLVNQNILTFQCNTLNTHSLLLSEQLQDSYRWCGVSLIPSSKHVLTALWKLWRAFIEYRLEKTYCRIENAHLCCLSSASAGLAGHHACFHRAEPSQLRVCSHLDKGVGVPNCCKTITKALP